MLRLAPAQSARQLELTPGPRAGGHQQAAKHLDRAVSQQDTAIGKRPARGGEAPQQLSRLLAARAAELHTAVVLHNQPRKVRGNQQGEIQQQGRAWTAS